MRIAILALFLLQARAEPNCQDELVQRANTFARAYNLYVSSRDVNEAKRMNDKEKLEKLWRRLYDCACF